MNFISTKSSSKSLKASARLPHQKHIALLLFLALCLIGLWLVNLSSGTVAIPVEALVQIFFSQEVATASWTKIFWKVRFPKAMAACLVGSALSVAGLQLQTLFRNPLASPSVLGVTAGASVGVASVLLTTGAFNVGMLIKQVGVSGNWLMIGAAFLGAFAVLLLILLVSLRIRDNVTLLIVGLMVANLTVALVGIWQYFSNPTQIRTYVLWTFGSLSALTYSQVPILSVVVIAGLLLSLGIAKPLNVLLLGDQYAQSLGVNIKRIRLFIIIITSLLAGSITAFCGPIGFVGIAVPHLVRVVFKTTNHYILIPACILVGASLLLLCDLVTQLPANDQVLPINAITSLIGSPIVIWIILRQKFTRGIF